MLSIPVEKPTKSLKYEGISFRWGGSVPHLGLDDFTLANFVRFCHHLSPLPNHDWIYRKFTEDTFPHAMIPVLCDQSLIQVVRSPQPFDILALNGETISLGTIVKTANQALGVCHFSSDGVSVITLLEDLQCSRQIIGIFEVPSGKN